MEPPEPFLVFTRKLNELGLRYMVSGSVAAIYYGEPRMTNDVDIIVFLRREDVNKVVEAFPEDGFYCPPSDVIEDERAREYRGHFNLIDHATGFKADIYPAGRDDLHSWGLGHTVKADVEGETVVFAPPEYVIVRKLQFYREGGAAKHLRDISRMLIAMGDDWNRAILEQMIQVHSLQPEWDKVIESEA